MNEIESTASFERLPPLLSGGIMLTYRCTNACRHCLYRCGPSLPDRWMSMETAERVFAALRDEPALSGIHLAGGEATLDMDRLEAVLRLAGDHGIPIDYLETNASWCIDDDAARAGFERLRQAGLDAVLISASPFHNEFVPFARTRACVEAAHAVFGTHGVLLYLPQNYAMLSRLAPERTHSLAEFCDAMGWDRRDPRVVQTYPLTLGGRVVTALRDFYPKHSAESFRRDKCRHELLSTHHFHIDPDGNLFTGLCVGIRTATAENFHPLLGKSTHPLLRLCSDGGPCALMDLAAAEHGFAPREQGYISKCDLCLHVREWLARHGEYDELQPADFYRDASATPPAE